MHYINLENFLICFKNYKNQQPFDHCVIDNFFLPGVVEKIENEFLDYEDQKWFCYKNVIEDKKALNDWGQFPPLTYKVFCELMSQDFVKFLSEGVGVELYVDHGLHGGGWHVHASGGNLNPHLDYSIHPKMGLQRKLNIIIYISSNLRPEHGGHLGFWSHSSTQDQPANLIKEIQPKFNRAVIFDTTQNSWHGMSRGLIQPEGIYRKSLAIYYLTDVPVNADQRERALFAARQEQKGDQFVEELIRKRADSKEFATVYRIGKE